jgi:hypothetical protein
MTYDPHYIPYVKENIFDLIYRSNIKAVQTQIHEGTSVDLKNDKGQTLLHYAVIYKQIEIAKLLISLGADLDVKDNMGQTVKYIIQNRYPELYNKLDKYTSDFSLIIESEQELVEDFQVQKLGSDSWCCIL